MLSPEIIEEISVLVRSGAYDKDRLHEIFCEEMYEPGELNPDEVRREIENTSNALAVEKQDWPPVTDCDLLDQAFEALNECGIIALHNAGNTQSDGFDDAKEAYRKVPDPATIRGYCFYHSQDLERAVRGGELYLAFGPMNPSDEETLGAEVGQLIRNELERVGLSVEWNNTHSKRICIPKMVWQRW